MHIFSFLEKWQWSCSTSQLAEHAAKAVRIAQAGVQLGAVLKKKWDCRYCFLELKFMAAILQENGCATCGNC